MICSVLWTVQTVVLVVSGARAFNNAPTDDAFRFASYSPCTPLPATAPLTTTTASSQTSRAYAAKA
jgi:hypothetical protein